MMMLDPNTVQVLFADLEPQMSDVGREIGFPRMA
jgi:hypothetical protein